MKTFNTLPALLLGLAFAALGGSAQAQAVPGNSLLAHASEYAAMGGFEKFMTMLALLFFGFILVLGAMALIAWVTSLLETLESPEGAPEAQPTETPTAAAATAASVPAASLAPVATSVQAQASAPAAPLVANGLVDANLIAVITAAASVALAGRRFRITRIRMATGTTSPWGLMGRQSIQGSHVIERKFK